MDTLMLKSFTISTMRDTIQERRGPDMWTMDTALWPCLLQCSLHTGSQGGELYPLLANQGDSKCSVGNMLLMRLLITVWKAQCPRPQSQSLHLQKSPLV